MSSASSSCRQFLTKEGATDQKHTHRLKIADDRKDFIKSKDWLYLQLLILAWKKAFLKDISEHKLCIYASQYGNRLSNTDTQTAKRALPLIC